MSGRRSEHYFYYQAPYKRGEFKAAIDKNHILIVEDDADIRSGIEIYLKNQGYDVSQAGDGIEGLAVIEKEEIDLAIVDIMMPRMDGITMMMKVREKGYDFPVIMLSAKSEEVDKIMGLNMGADDYITKPFTPLELLARVNSLIRRYTTLNPFTADIDSISLKDMVIDKLNRTVTVKDIPVLLTGKEFDLLLFLASNKGRVFTKKQIYSQVWEEEYAFDDSNIMSFISKLRKKIEPDPDHPFYILTVRGVGYRFNKEA